MGRHWRGAARAAAAIPAEVKRGAANVELLAKHGFNGAARAWRTSGPARARARSWRAYDFVSGGGVIEDPAMAFGANLGGWMIATGVSLPVRY